MAMNNRNILYDKLSFSLSVSMIQYKAMVVNI